ncbi:hypothetical protein C8R43DRAFT_891506 [Mycena crocata]|nr:hypothetical protein C8R43DRAFT_891506 [Mycena crocata]
MEPESSACALPLYSPSHPSPCYSQDPTCDETTLDVSPRTGIRRLPTGIFTKACGSTTVVLFDQETGVEVPSYGKQAIVKGSLILENDAKNICEVVAKLDGRMEVVTADSGAMTVKTVKNIYPLWSSGSSPSSCPQTIDFACELPAKFQHQDAEYPLPPSYTSNFTGFPALLAKCTYTLSISITKDRRLGFLSKTKLIQIPIQYNPQSSPPRAISATESYFLDAVKTMPEEWYQSSFTMKPRTSSKLSPIQCQAFSPSVRVFGLRDTIPIHLQMSGPLSSLREFILPTNSVLSDIDLNTSPVRCFLTRMVTFEYRGKSTWRVLRMGEGRILRPLPPVVDFDCDCHPTCVPVESCVQTLDWEGEIQCDGNVDVGGFQAAGLTVKDFITLELVPPKAATSPLLTIQHAIPIRFVTDSFIAPT